MINSKGRLWPYLYKAEFEFPAACVTQADRAHYYRMASMNEYVCNSICFDYNLHIPCHKDPPAIQLSISVETFTKMVEDGIFGPSSPASGALQRNLQSYDTFIAYSKERHQIEVEKREEEERLRRKGEAAQAHALQLLRFAQGRIHELQQEIAYLRSMHVQEWNTMQGNPQSLSTTNNWRANSDAYPYACS